MSKLEAPTRGVGEKRIGILIVAYDAASTIATVLRRIPYEVWSEVTEVLVLDDASKDTTYEAALEAKASLHLDKVTVLRNPQNLGYGGNQKRGYRYFMGHGFDAVVLLHGDAQYAPEMLASLYEQVVEGDAHAVFGTRMNAVYGGPLRGGMPLYKLLGNRVLSAFETALLGLPLSEFHSGYRAYCLHALRRIQLESMTNDFHFDSEIIVKLHHQGFIIREVPVPTHYGDEVCHVNGLRYALDVVRSVLRYQRTLQGRAPAHEYAEYQGQRSPRLRVTSAEHLLDRWLAGQQDSSKLKPPLAPLLPSLTSHSIVGLGLKELSPSLEVSQRGVQPEEATGLDQVLRGLAGQSYSVLMLLDVLEQASSPKRALQACEQLISPSGCLLVRLPNRANLWHQGRALCGGFHRAHAGPPPTSFLTLLAARALLAEYGWQVVELGLTPLLAKARHHAPQGAWNRLLAQALTWLTESLPGLLGHEALLIATPPQGARTSPACK